MSILPAEGPMGSFLQRHDEDGFLEAMRLLVQSKKVKTAADLVRYAESAREPNAAEFIRPLAEEGLPVDLILDSLSAEVRIKAWRRQKQLVASCQGKKIGLVAPLPPHVLETFQTMADAQILIADGHKVPASYRGKWKEHKGGREGRKVAPDMDVLVFEAHRKDGSFSVDQAVGDIVDLRIIPASCRLLVHLRPHAHPDDVAFTVTNHSIQIL